MRTLVADRGAGEPISLGAALAAGKKVAPQATGLLAQDHRVVLGWFGWYEQTTDEVEKRAIAHRICTALRAHMAAEEEHFYPETRAAAGDADADDSVKRAVQEHEGARRLMEQIEGNGRSAGSRDDLMRELRAEIEAHVDEEELELFPMAAENVPDLYELGRQVATRRVDQLLAVVTAERRRESATNPSQRARQTNAPMAKEEYPVMSIDSDVARKYFVSGLKNAHATVKEGKTMVDKEIKRLKHYPRLKERLELHSREKSAQLERLERILKEVGDKPSTAKDAAMTLMANLGATANAAAADEVIRNSFALLGLAKAEAAAFETLILFGQAAGVDGAALRSLQQCLSEERGMAAFVEENLRGVGMGFLQLESQGMQASR